MNLLSLGKSVNPLVVAKTKRPPGYQEAKTRPITPYAADTHTAETQDNEAEQRCPGVEMPPGTSEN